MSEATKTSKPQKSPLLAPTQSTREWQRRDATDIPSPATSGSYTNLKFNVTLEDHKTHVFTG